MITNELFGAGLAHGGGTYAVSLKFSSGSSEEISSAVESMARVTGNSALAGKNAPPHLTLGMFHVSGSDVPVLLKSFSEFAESQRFPIEIEFGGIDAFLTKVIFLSLKSGSESEKLVRKLNAALHGIFLGHFEPGGNRNYLPERFFPHVALALKLGADGFKKGMEFSRAVPVPEKAAAVSVSLARCRPYEEIGSFPISFA